MSNSNKIDIQETNMDDRHLLASEMVLEVLAMSRIPSVEIALEVLSVAAANIATHGKTERFTAEQVKSVVDRAFSFVKATCQCEHGPGAKSEHVH